MRWIIATLVALMLLACTGAAMARGGPRAPARGGPRVPAFPSLPGQWSHAEINVTIKRVQHTLILDQGRIKKASGTEITLVEPDGTPAVIALSPQTIVQVKGRRRSVFVLRRQMLVQTMRIDDGAAVRVRTAR
jgi:hypothetical protein